MQRVTAKRSQGAAALAGRARGEPKPWYNGAVGRSPNAVVPRAAPAWWALAALAWALASPAPRAREEVVVVQGVSDDGRSFVVRRGRIHGIVEGMEALFSTDKSSIAARVAEMSRETSLWTMSEPRGSAPFAAEDMVLFSNDLGNLAAKTPTAPPEEALWGGGDVIEEEGRLDLLARSRLNRRRRALGTGGRRLILRAGLASALRETVSGVPAMGGSRRSGLRLEGLHSWPLGPGADAALGFRLDRDSAVQTSPRLVVAVSRALVAAEATVRLNALGVLAGGVPGGLYLGLGAAYGASRSEAAGLAGSGRALVLPAVKAGHEMALGGRWSLLLEGGVEYAHSSETLAGGLGEQETGVLGAKASLGLARRL